MLHLFLLLLFVTSPAHAAIFWDDELESGNTGYTLPTGYASTPMTFDTTVKFSGSGSLRYNFDSVCYPDSSAQTNCGGFTDRTFTPTATLYKRFYIRLSSGFTVSDVFTKLMRSDTTGLTSNWWTLGCCGQKLMEVHDQNVPVGNTSVYYTSYTMPTNQWVCIETLESLNTPGQANGIQQAWADGVQILNVTNVPYRAGNDSSLYNNNRLYRQTGLGSIWFDRLAVGDTRIGCIGSPTTGDTTPPAPPTAVTASATSGSTVGLAWTNPADSDLAGVTIRRCTGTCTPTTALTTVSAPSASYTDSSAAPGTTYSYAVNSYDTSGNQSAYTTAVTVTTPTTFRTVVGTHSFNVADTTALPAPWTDGYTGHTNGSIVSQQFRGTVTNTSDPKSVEQFATAVGNDHYCQITLATFTGSEDKEYGCAVRMANPPTIGWYWCYARKTATNSPARNSAIVSHHPGGVGDFNVASDFSTVWGSGDKLICEAQGTALRLIRIPAGSTTETTILSATDSEFTTGTTGLVAWMATGGTLANAAIDDYVAGSFSSASTSTIALDATSQSATSNITNTISWTHAVGSGSNRLLAVCLYSRDDANAADVPVVSVTANGLPLTKVRADLIADVPGSVWINTELWYLIAPSTGSHTITATWTGALNRYGVGASASYTGVLQASPLDAHAGGTGTGTAMAAAITTVTNHAMIQDCAAARGNPMTIGAGQTSRVAFDTTTPTVDSVGLSTVMDKAVAGGETMDWTQSAAQSWAVSAAAFKPAQVTAVVPPTITGLSLTGTSATLTYGATTPTTIRVTIGSNSSPVTITTVEPISAFPSGVYTKTWPDGYDFVCFYPRDASGVENTDPNANKCGSLVGIVAALDTTPIVMTQTFPTGTLNQGTTSTTIAASLNKSGACRYSTSNVAYDTMTLAMAVANNTASVSVSGLTNGTTTHYYVHCRFTNAVGTDITTSTALDVAVTVANTAPSDTTAPSTVTNLVGVSLSQSQVQLTWTAATDNVAVSAYQVYQDLTGTCASFSTAGAPVATTSTIANLPPGTPVSFVVRAIDSSQNRSAADSNCVTVTTAPLADSTPPSTMTNLRVLASYRNAVLLAFDGGTDNAGQPKASIEYCTGANCSAFTVANTGLATQQLIVNLTPNSVVCFRGIFTDAAGNPSAAYSPVVCTTTLSAGLDRPRDPIPFGVSRLPRN